MKDQDIRTKTGSVEILPLKLKGKQQIDPSQIMNNLNYPEGSGEAGVFLQDETKQSA
nr:hypothetical protein [uncultured Methanolobus sp.]